MAIEDSDRTGSDLQDLRVEIDRIDAAMHELLIDRSAIIDRLIAIKARQGGGSAFRPGREAEMMRRLAERHRGRLPLDTVESIWRVIISTFTYVQANYDVHADMAGGDAAMRDCARFHFGWTVPLRSHFGPEAVIAAVARAEGDLGLVRVEGHVGRGAWWRSLTAPGAPKIIARLPFVERPDHPAAMPVFVVARPLAAAAARDVTLYAAAATVGSDSLSSKLASLDCHLLGCDTDPRGGSLLIEAPGQLAAARLADVLDIAPDSGLCVVGSHAARFEIGSDSSTR